MAAREEPSPAPRAAPRGSLPESLRSPAALAVLFGLTLVAHREFVFRGQLPAFGDGLRMSLPQRSFMVSELAQGRFPLWLPFEGLGEPFFAQLIPGVLHPLNLVYALLPFEKAFGWNLVLATFLGAAGAFVLARGAGASRLAALLAGGAFGLSGPLVTQMNLTYLVANATVPWAVAGFALAARRPRPLTLLLGALGLAAVLFAGDPQSVIVAFALGAVEAWTRPPAERRRAFLALGAWGVLSALLGAVQLLPAAEAFLASSRAQGSFGALTRWSLPPMRLAELVAPGLFAGPEYEALLGTGMNAWTPAVFLGPVAVVFAVLGAMTDRRARAYGLFALLLLWAALGPSFGLYRLVGALPLLRAFQYAEKLLPFAILAGAVAAAHGVDAWERASSARSLGLAGAAVVALLLCAAPAVLGSAPTFAAHARNAMLVTLALTGLSLLALARLRAALPLVIALGLVPQALANSLPNLFAPPAAVLGTPWSVAVVRAASSSPFPARVVPLIAPDAPSPMSPEGVAAARAALRTAFNTRYAIESLDLPYHPFVPPGFERLFSPPDQDRRARVFGAELALVLGHGEPDAAWTLVARHPQLPLSVWRTDQRLPRAYVARAARQVPSRDAAIEAVSAPDFQASEHIVVECPVTAADAAPAPRGEVELRGWAPDEVVLAANLQREGFVVLNDSFAAGWQATVDGAPAALCRANALVRAVRVPAGAHELVFTYAPRGFSVGLVISALTLVGLLLAELVRRRRAASPGYSP